MHHSFGDLHGVRPSQRIPSCRSGFVVAPQAEVNTLRLTSSVHDGLQDSSIEQFVMLKLQDEQTKPSRDLLLDEPLQGGARFSCTGRP
jgi:hypothetical protein